MFLRLVFERIFCNISHDLKFLWLNFATQDMWKVFIQFTHQMLGFTELEWVTLVTWIYWRGGEERRRYRNLGGIHFSVFRFSPLHSSLLCEEWFFLFKAVLGSLTQTTPCPSPNWALEIIIMDDCTAESRCLAGEAGGACSACILVNVLLFPPGELLMKELQSLGGGRGVIKMKTNRRVFAH